MSNRLQIYPAIDLAGVSEEELRQYLSQREAGEQPKPRKKRGNK